MSAVKQAFSGLVLLVLSADAVLASKPVERENDAVRAFRKAGPAVVSIRALRVVQYRGALPGDFMNPDFFNDFFFGPRARRQEESLGSGVIIDPRGYILTNQHVIQAASKILVSLQNGAEVSAELIGADYPSDLAVLKISTSQKLAYLPMGTSSDLMIGESVIAIGNPFGLGHTLTVGTVSSLHRKIQVNDRVYGEFIQTDASINPGNSGGALLNIVGELVGITTAIYAKAQGIGFAIPIDKAKRIVDDLIAYGSVQPGWLGIDVEDLTPELSAALSVAPGAGVMISWVWPESPAEKAGLKPGMAVVELDEKPVGSRAAFKEIMGDITRNDEVKIKYLDQGQEKTIAAKAEDFPARLAPRLCWRLLGIEVSAARGQGVVISKIDASSPAGKIGVSRGDMILRLNQSQLLSINDFYQALIRGRNQASVIVVIKRQNIYYYVTLPLRG